MKLSLQPADLRHYIVSLLSTYFPDGLSAHVEIDTINYALERLEYSQYRINKKYYQVDKLPVFNHLNADHFASFLWFLGNTIFKHSDDDLLPTKLSYLNKIMHGIDLFFSVEMPDVFMLVHPVGSIIGHASFNNYLMIYQNCSVGATDSEYPVFGEGVVLYSKSSVLGASKVGDNVLIGANTLVVNSSVSNNTIIVGQKPNLRSWGYTGSVICDKFGMM